MASMDFAPESGLPRQVAPNLQFLLHIFARGFRLQAERVAAKVDTVRAVRHLWNVKTVTKVQERIASRLLRGEFLRRPNGIAGT